MNARSLTDILRGGSLDPNERNLRWDYRERLKKKAKLLKDLCKLYVLEARDRPVDREYLMSAARHIFQRMKKTEARIP